MKNFRERFQLRLREKNNLVGAKPVCLPGEKNILESLRDSPVCFWIDSSGGPKHLCNQSFHGTNPKYYFYGYLDEVYLKEARKQGGKEVRICENCFDFLEEKIKEEKNIKDGIFVGYFSYDLFQRSREKSYPDFFFAYFDEVTARKPERLTKQSHSSVENLIDILCSNMTDTEYFEKVKFIKEEIRKGNVYQVNLTREYFIKQSAVSSQQSALEIYLRLRKVSPNPYGCFFKTPFLTILSSSPEEFLFIKDGYIRTRPIKGTLSKGIFKIDEKNKAENIMIADLERNDLGKICKVGSIRADRLLEVESYKHLNHVVSTVEGRLKENIKLRDIFDAVFPSGSITGAPKIAAIKIIDALEPTKRGAYTGSFGYIRTDGTMNFNILIRTILVHSTQKSKIVFNVGGGIVADSDPQAELEEINLKAKGIMNALGIC